MGASELIETMLINVKQPGRRPHDVEGAGVCQSIEHDAIPVELLDFVARVSHWGGAGCGTQERPSTSGQEVSVD